MNDLFVWLTMLSIVLLVASMIKRPKSKNGEPFKRRYLAAGFGGLTLVLLFLVGATDPQPSQTLQSNHTAAHSQSQQASLQKKPAAQASAKTNQSTVNASPSQQSAVKPVQAAQHPQPTTLDLLWTALDNSGQDRNSVNIDYLSASQTADGYGGLVTFSRDDLSPWDSNAFVRDFLTHFVKYGQQAFKIPGVDHLDFIVYTNFVDDHGNTSKDIGMEVKISQASFDSFNWQNLAGTPVYDALVGASEYDYLAYAIRKNVDTSQVILLLD